MSDNTKRHESSDEGELSDASGRHSPSRSPEKKEGRKQHKRITYTISDDESGEMFAIQPKDSKNHERRDRNPLKHKHDKRDDERYKERHEEKHKRREERRDKERREKDPSKQKERHHREKDKKRHENRTESRKHKRSTTPEDMLPKKREKKPSESNTKKYEIPIFAHTKEKFSAKKIEVQEVEHSPPPMEDDDSVIEEAAIVTREGGVTTFTLDSPAGPMKYSKFDSSPEHEHEEVPEKTPDHSDTEIKESEPEEEDDEEESIIEPSFDVENVRWEDLSEEQKAMLTPDSKKRLEDDWQARLIAELPVYYPGVQGCRNVEEFKCENKIEEGTYGVVFRARDKRTEEVVALKRLKMEKEREGFPITSLREINMLLKCGNHPNIVNVREVVIGSTLDKIYLVMEFVEHDMKSLMETMRQKNKTFSVGVQKSLMKQLLSGLKHMHDLWILHRDLKTSNLLLSHRGILKIADFGLAREFGEPLKPYTSVVVTLWYRAPELLLEQKVYSTPIDMWSVGCIMGEFILQKPLFPGQNEQSQIDKIFLELGTPNEKIWPGYEQLPLVKKVQLPHYPRNQLRIKFPAAKLNESGFQLLNGMLLYDPERRFTAEEALQDKWFSEPPEITPPEMFPTFPAKSEQHRAPPIVHQQKKKEEAPLIVNATTAKLMAELNVNPEKMRHSGFSLKF